MYCIRDMDPSQRPRERLLEHGPQALSDAELLAVLLRTGGPGSGVVAEAHGLLATAGGLLELARMVPAELLRRPGFGPAKAATLAAAFELGRRLGTADLRARPRLEHPRLAGELLVRHLQGRRAEVFGYLALDGSHRVLRHRDLVLGTRDQAPVDAADLLRCALLDGAAEVLVYHNHPSGALAPSPDDLTLTRRLAAAGGLVGVPIIDHILVAGARWLSLRQSHPAVFDGG